VWIAEVDVDAGGNGDLFPVAHLRTLRDAPISVKLRVVAER